METIWIEEYDEMKEKLNKKYNKLSLKLRKLKKAANALYDAGFWQCDRKVEENELWEALRDALGRKKGTSPEKGMGRRVRVGRVRRHGV